MCALGTGVQTCALPIFMVMSRHSRDLLVERYGAPRDLLQILPHGAPDRPFGRSARFKKELGLEGRNVLMTFGLLGPGKGLARVIQALPSIVARHPGTVSRIVRATHPTLVPPLPVPYPQRLPAAAASLLLSRLLAFATPFFPPP